MIIKLKPLSVNKCWKGRRFKTKDYLDYEKCLLLMIGKQKMIKGYVEVEYHFHIKNYKMSDVGNFEKPLSDIIVKAGMIEDDRFIKRLIIEKFKSNQEYLIIKKKKNGSKLENEI